MRRRDLLLLATGALALLPSAAPAQQKTAVIGLLSSGGRTTSLPAFIKALSEAGYIEGKNLTIEYRWAEGNYDRLPAWAADLVARKVDLIAATGNAVGPAKDATSTIPIVFNSGRDPVAEGWVSSFARPGGNITGITPMVSELMPKRFEVISELVPEAKEIALLVNPLEATSEGQIREVQEVARTKGVRLHIVKASTADEIDAAFAAVAKLRAGALVIGADPLFDTRVKQLVALAASHAIPTIDRWRQFPDYGGLISYGTNGPDIWRQLGIYAGRILNGAKPADLPVQRPTKFELVVNLNTAGALGIAVPHALLQRADEVIE